MLKNILSKFKNNSDENIEEIKEQQSDVDYKIRLAVERDILPARIDCEPIYIITSIIAEKGTFFNRYYNALYSQNKMTSPYSFEEFLVSVPIDISGAQVIKIEMPQKHTAPDLCKSAYIAYNQNFTKYLYIAQNYDDKMYMWADGEFEELGEVCDNEIEIIENAISEEGIFDERYSDILETLTGDTKKKEPLLTDNEKILEHSKLFLGALINVQKLKEENKREEASRLIKEVIKKETLKYENDDLIEYHSFRNSFEVLLYSNLYHPYNPEKQEKKQIVLTQEDLAGAYLVYGVMMLEQKQYDKALDILWQGHKINPVNISILFAIADAYKGKNYLKSYHSAISMAHSCAVRKQDISRIYKGYAYYYTQIKDYDAAFSFVYAAKCFDALGFTNSLREIEKISEKTFKEPTVDELKETLNARNIFWGAKELTVSVISLLEKEFFQSQNQQGMKMCAELKKEITFEN